MQFLTSIVGEWIGTCEQSTDGEQADDKYFHAAIRQVDEISFDGQFHYYRFDTKTGKPLSIGESKVIFTVEPDGTAKSSISGSGIVLVNDRPKNQQHELVEILSASGGGLQGKPGGKISVSGMPLGFGKGGRVLDGKSDWSVADGVLSVHQILKVGFRALIFTKSFDIEARYTAKRGSDIASLMRREARLSPSIPERS